VNPVEIVRKIRCANRWGRGEFSRHQVVSSLSSKTRNLHVLRYPEFTLDRTVVVCARKLL
jgi:hypothetical protein